MDSILGIRPGLMEIELRSLRDSLLDKFIEFAEIWLIRFRLAGKRAGLLESYDIPRLILDGIQSGEIHPPFLGRDVQAIRI